MSYVSIVDEFLEMIPKFMDHLIPSIVIIFVFACLCKAVSADGVLAKRVIAMADPITAKPLARTLFTTFRKIIWIVGLMTLAGEWSFDLRPVLTSLGIVSMVGALAAQDMVKNFLGACIIIIGDVFRVGDTINVSGVTGVVESLNFRSTQIRMDDGSVVYVPNASFSNSNVRKFKS